MIYYHVISFDNLCNGNCIIAGLNDIISKASTVLRIIEWARQVAGSKVS